MSSASVLILGLALAAVTPLYSGDQSNAERARDEEKCGPKPGSSSEVSQTLAAMAYAACVEEARKGAGVEKGSSSGGTPEESASQADDEEQKERQRVEAIRSLMSRINPKTFAASPKSSGQKTEYSGERSNKAAAAARERANELLSKEAAGWKETCAAAVIYERSGQPGLAAPLYGKCAGLAYDEDTWDYYAAALKRTAGLAAGLNPKPAPSQGSREALEAAYANLQSVISGGGAINDSRDQWLQAVLSGASWKEPHYALAEFGAVTLGFYKMAGAPPGENLINQSIIHCELFLLITEKDRDQRRQRVREILAELRAALGGKALDHDWFDGLGRGTIENAVRELAAEPAGNEAPKPAAAPKKNLEAPEELLALGEKYETGRGVEKDEKEAFRLYSRAAQLGNQRACLRLADMYNFGMGQIESDEKLRAMLAGEALPTPLEKQGPPDIEKDPSKAAIFYRKAAEAGEPKACYMLSALLGRGSGVTQNAAESKRWLLRAAELGYPPAIFSLSELPPRGEAADMREARLWKQRGVDAGIAIIEMIWAGELMEEGRKAECLRVLERCAGRGVKVCGMALESARKEQ